MSEPSDSNDPLFIWTLYKSPTDFAPGTFVARKWEVKSDGYGPTDELIASTSLDQLRSDMAQRGLVPLSRHPLDDPTIIETWL